MNKGNLSNARNSRTALFQVLSEPEGEHQQHPHYPKGETVGYVENEMHRINASLENRQANHQTSMVEVQGMIQNLFVTILIDPGASLSYISPGIVEKCKLSLKKFEKSWLVQVATGTKRKVVNYVESCNLMMN